MLTEVLVAILTIFLIVIYVYHKYVIWNFWRKKNVFYVEPSAAENYMTAFFGQMAMGKYYYNAQYKNSIYNNNRSIL